MSTAETTGPSAATQRRIKWILALGLLVGGAFGLHYYIDNFWPFWHFRTVEKGSFYRSSQLGEQELKDAIKDYGIKTIFNLRHESERGRGDWYEVEKRVAEANGARVVDISLQAGTPPSPEQIEVMLAIMDDKANRPVIAHCYHGSIRSAAAEGLFRREYMGETGAEAYARVETWGRDLEKDYPLIADFIKNYVPRRDRKKAPAEVPTKAPDDAPPPK